MHSIHACVASTYDARYAASTASVFRLVLSASAASPKVRRHIAAPCVWLRSDEPRLIDERSVWCKLLHHRPCGTLEPAALARFATYVL